MNKTKEQLESLKNSQKAINNIYRYYKDYNEYALYEKAKNYINTNHELKKKEKRDIERKKEKAVSKLEQDTRESIDELLLTAVDQLGNYDSFKSYEKDVQDWSWENIMNGE